MRQKGGNLGDKLHLELILELALTRNHLSIAFQKKVIENFSTYHMFDSESITKLTEMISSNDFCTLKTDKMKNVSIYFLNYFPNLRFVQIHARKSLIKPPPKVSHMMCPTQQ